MELKEFEQWLLARRIPLHYLEVLLHKHGIDMAELVEWAEHPSQVTAEVRGEDAPEGATFWKDVCSGKIPDPPFTKGKEYYTKAGDVVTYLGTDDYGRLKFRSDASNYTVATYHTGHWGSLMPSPMDVLLNKATLTGTSNAGNIRSRPELIDPEFILAIGRVMAFGAEKYEVDGWKTMMSDEYARDRTGSLLRHILAYKSGEETDPETGESHLAHAACNLMFLLYHQREGGKKND